MVTPTPDPPTMQMQLMRSIIQAVSDLATAQPDIRELGPLLDTLTAGARALTAAEPDPAVAAGYVLSDVSTILAGLRKSDAGPSASTVLCRVVALGLITGISPSRILAGDPAEDPS